MREPILVERYLHQQLRFLWEFFLFAFVDIIPHRVHIPKAERSVVHHEKSRTNAEYSDVWNRIVSFQARSRFIERISYFKRLCIDISLINCLAKRGVDIWSLIIAYQHTIHVHTNSFTNRIILSTQQCICSSFREHNKHDQNVRDLTVLLFRNHWLSTVVYERNLPNLIQIEHHDDSLWCFGWCCCRCFIQMICDQIGVTCQRGWSSLLLAIVFAMFLRVTSQEVFSINIKQMFKWDWGKRPNTYEGIGRFSTFRFCRTERDDDFILLFVF